MSDSYSVSLGCVVSLLKMSGRSVVIAVSTWMVCFVDWMRGGLRLWGGCFFLGMSCVVVVFDLSLSGFEGDVAARFNDRLSLFLLFLNFSAFGLHGSPGFVTLKYHIHKHT